MACFHPEPPVQTKSPHVLLIDDDAAVLAMVSEMLTSFGMHIHAYADGRRALQALEDPESPAFDLVISDINMEGMDGFDVIHRVKAVHTKLPVVLMTATASLDYAIRAMRMGAANLFQKPLSIRELVNNVFHLVELHRELRLAESSLKGLVREARDFAYTSSSLDIPSTVLHLTDRLVHLGFAKSTNVDVITMAYHEALVNALEHGNLELDSSLKGDLFSEQDAYTAILEQRLQDPAYASRPVHVAAEMTPERYEVVITDGGNGFDISSYARVNDDSITRQCGRGLALIHMVMDEVSFNEKGNQIRMVLRKK
jgi:DNA-binding response OmpR family regulator